MRGQMFEALVRITLDRTLAEVDGVVYEYEDYPVGDGNVVRRFWADRPFRVSVADLTDPYGETKTVYAEALY